MDSGLCGFAVRLLWGDAADGEADALPIVVVFDVSEQVTRAILRLHGSRGWTSSVFGVPKKLSIGALSRNLPPRAALRLAGLEFGRGREPSGSTGGNDSTCTVQERARSRELR